MNNNKMNSIKDIDPQTIKDMIEDLEAYYRSEIFIQHHGLAEVGAKMLMVQKVKKALEVSDVPKSEDR